MKLVMKVKKNLSHEALKALLCPETIEKLRGFVEESKGGKWENKLVLTFH